MLIAHLKHGAILLYEFLSFNRPWIRLQYLIHTALPEQMPLSNFPTRVKPRLTRVVIVGRNGIWVVVDSTFLYHVAIEVVIEALNFLFICFLVEPMRVPATVDLVDQIPLLFHQRVVVLIKNYRVDSTVLWRQIMLLPILLRVEWCVTFYWVVQWSLLGVVDWDGFRPESVLLIYSTTHAPSVHLYSLYLILINFIHIFMFCFLFLTLY